MECKISKASSFLQRVLYCGGVPVGGGEVTMEAQNGASSEESVPESWKIRHLTSQSLVQNGRCPPGSVILQITTKRAREWGMRKVGEVSHFRCHRTSKVENWT